jgi:hypothetical protein
MTIRAIILGCLGAAIIGGFGYLHGSVLHLGGLVGNHLPPSVFGGLVLVVMAANPLLRRLSRRAPLRPAELAVALSLTLVGCAVPGGGLMQTFTTMQVVPIRRSQQEPWLRHLPTDYIPPQMLLSARRDELGPVRDFVNGLRGVGEPWIGLGDVPWNRWRRSLTTWLPIVVLLAVGAVCLAIVVHRQWSSHERLRYPIAEIAYALIDQPAPGAWPAVFRSRGFWLAAGAVFVVRVINGIHAYWPESIHIPLDFPQFTVVLSRHGDMDLVRYGPWHNLFLFHPRIWPVVVGVAFFLATDVSLSVGLATGVHVVWFALLARSGVDMSGTQYSGAVDAWLRAGAWVGLTLLVIYVGRSYYGRLLRRAVGLGRGEEAEGHAVWAMRIGLLASAALAAYLHLAVGLDPLLAALGVVLFGVIYLGMSRLNAEAGLIMSLPYWQPAAVLFGLFGAVALGANHAAILIMLSIMLAVGARAALMPFVVNGLKITERAQVRPERIGWAGIGVYTAVVGLAVVVVLWANYNFGMDHTSGWINQIIPNKAFGAMAQVAAEAEESGRLEASLRLGTWERLRAMQPDRRFVAAFSAGLGLVLLLSFLRLRLPWWPLHPVLLLVGGTFPCDTMGHSFLLGCLIKVVVTRLGGAEMYRKAKPVMMGIIVADLVAAVTFMGVRAAHHLVEPWQRVVYQTMP